MIEWKRSFAWGIDRIIENLNPRIMGWCSYFNKVVAKRTFIQLDRWMWMRQARFACRTS
ncbi:group II intron, maturase-specific domain protein [Rickettsia hoogstraalii str. RCCE3]|nr:group II intron, maturase-specific domain protein [Rickettsia hoogstraalii str. RCCE3]